MAKQIGAQCATLIGVRIRRDGERDGSFELLTRVGQRGSCFV